MQCAASGTKPPTATPSPSFRWLATTVRRVANPLTTQSGCYRQSWTAREERRLSAAASRLINPPPPTFAIPWAGGQHPCTPSGHAFARSLPRSFGIKWRSPSSHDSCWKARVCLWAPRAEVRPNAPWPRRPESASGGMPLISQNDSIHFFDFYPALPRGAHPIPARFRAGAPS